MTLPSKNILSANGIFISDVNKGLYCALCKEVPNSNNWLDHIKSTRHTIKFSRFESIFVNKETNIHCKICSVNYNWNDLEIHAIEHEILPWYKPPDRYKIFFENHMLQWCNRFYCYACDEIFLEWSAAFAHANEKSHKDLLKARKPDKKSLAIEETGLTYAKLITHALIPWKNTNIACKICDCSNIGIKNCIQHIEGSRHRDARMSFIQGLRVRTKRKIADEQMSNNEMTLIAENENYLCGYGKDAVDDLQKFSSHAENPSHEFSRSGLTANDVTSGSKNERTTSEIEKQLSDGATSDPRSLSRDYIVESSATDLYCAICNLTFRYRVSVEGHVAGKRHATRRDKFHENKITVMENNNFHCGFCDCRIKALDKVFAHIDAKAHACSRIVLTNNGNRSDRKNEATSMKKKNDSIKNEIKKQPPVGASVHPRSLSRDYIVKDSETHFYCAVCDCTIINRVNIKDHVCGKPHLKGRKKFQDNKITFKEDNWHCDFCKCKIPGYDNVHLHINGQRHNIAKLRNHELPESEKTSTKPRNIERKFPYRYIVEYNETHAYCKICDCSIGGYVNIEQHVRGNRHASSSRIFTENKISFERNDVYHCKCCNFRIYSNVTVHDHIKGFKHLSAMNKLKNPKDPESQDPGDKVPRTQSVGSTSKGSRDSGLKDPGSKAPGSVDPKLKDSAKRSLQNLSHDYVVKTNYMDSLCRICDCTVSGGQRNVDDHVAGRSHAASLRKYGCESITLVAGTKDYYCKSCDCRIPGTENLWRHARGKMHAGSRISKNAELGVSKISSDSRISIKSKVNPRPMKFGGLSNDKAKTGPTNNSRDSFVRKIWKRQIYNLAKLTNCNVCGTCLASVVELHSHLASHLSNDFHGRNVENFIDHEADTRISLKSLNLISEPIITVVSEIENFSSPEAHLERFVEATVKEYNMKEIVKELNLANDYIYSMSEKLKELELGMKLSFAKLSNEIYCLVCQKTTECTMENYLQHLRSLDHCVNFENMESDHLLFQKYPDQFSAIHLGLEYMEETSKDLVACNACDVMLENNDVALKEHMTERSHVEACRVTRLTTMRHFDDVKLAMQCDWYKIQLYRCVPCLQTFRNELNFVEHFDSEDHLFSMKRPINTRRQLVFDFCEACALLWYGYRRTWAYHREIETHVWLIRDGHYISTELPKLAKDHLTKLECYINETMKIYDDLREKEREKERIVIEDLEIAMRRKYYRAQAHAFGSRVTGVGSADSDIDVFLDCGDMYDGNNSSRDAIMKFMDDTAECLNEDSLTWSVEELVKTCRCPIIQVHHRPTGLDCDISFENGLAVECTNLIKSYIDVFPLCRKMIIFLKCWTNLCKLSGSDRLTSYAIYWHVIFYLQHESILPSVAKLISMNNESRRVAGWEVGVAREFTRNETKAEHDIRQLIARFFQFWGNFDHRHDVACPIIGKILKKKDFAVSDDLPNDVIPHGDCTIISTKEEAFRVDSAMCIQDPFCLRRNITKAVRKNVVNRFRKYCLLSYDILRL